MESTKRTVTCGDLRAADVGKKVVLNGWVSRTRDLGGLVFIRLRDRYGITQVMVGDKASDKVKQIASSLKSEYCIAVEGVVAARAEKDINRDMATGEIEVEANDIEIFTTSQELPFSIEEVRQKDGTIVLPNEDLRLKYRYLDLRRDPMQQNIILRSQVTFATREYLTSKGFLEIETPTFIKSTPEGARDYLVPSRVHPGKFYSLPQSPQLYKQLLMVSGFDKYFQIARCYRDEDARGDRQPEFTQIDVETSFMTSDDVREIMEEMVVSLFKELKGTDLGKLPVLTWDEAMDRFGSDKPDLRVPFELKTLDEAVKNSSFSLLSENANDENSRVIGFALPGGASLSRKKIDEYTDYVKKLGASGLLYIKVNDLSAPAEGLKASFAKHVTADEVAELAKLAGAKSGDLVFIGCGQRVKCATFMGALRLKTAKDANLVESGYKALWVVKFPMFEMTEEAGITAMHHPFTSPVNETPEQLKQNPMEVYADAYDIVINGYESGGGSVRIYDQNMQNAVFSVLGISQEEAREKFGFLLDALSYGAPPHAGIAFGLDRLTMLITEVDNIREVIAFPKTTAAACLMTDAPNVASSEALKELATAKVWIDNLRKVNHIRKGLDKKDSQYYINTWHGSLGII